MQMPSSRYNFEQSKPSNRRDTPASEELSVDVGSPVEFPRCDSIRTRRPAGPCRRASFARRAPPSRRLARSPRWAGVLALTLVSRSSATPRSSKPKSGGSPSWINGSARRLAFGQTVDDARYATFERCERKRRRLRRAQRPGQRSRCSPPASRRCSSPSSTASARRRRATVQVLAVVAHAGVILALRQVVAAPLNYSRETLASPTTLRVLSRCSTKPSPLARFFGVIDLFVIWWVVVLAHRDVGALPAPGAATWRSASSAPTSRWPRCWRGAMALAGGTA